METLRLEVLNDSPEVTQLGSEDPARQSAQYSEFLTFILMLGEIGDTRTEAKVMAWQPMDLYGFE